MSDIPEGYTPKLWDITFYMEDENGEPLTNEDGAVRTFKESEVDWSFLDTEDIPTDVMKEVNEKGDYI